VSHQSLGEGENFVCRGIPCGSFCSAISETGFELIDAFCADLQRLRSEISSSRGTCAQDEASRVTNSLSNESKGDLWASCVLARAECGGKVLQTFLMEEEE
jgi:hypothetical protein